MTAVRTLVFATALALGAALAAEAAELQRIVLRDGSSVVAEVRALEGGVYRLESPSLGTLRIEQQRVRSIQPLEASPEPAARPAAPPAPDPAKAGELRALQQEMISDPATVAALLRLRELPEMQAVLADPEILQAVARGDLAALEKNPKIRRLMEARAVRDLSGRVAPAK